MYTFNYNANIGSTIGYRFLLVASISDIGTSKNTYSTPLFTTPDAALHHTGSSLLMPDCYRMNKANPKAICDPCYKELALVPAQCAGPSPH